MTIAIYNEQLLSYFLFNTKLFTPHPLWGTWTHKSSSLCGLLFHHNLHRGCSSAFASASIRGCWVLTRQRLVEDRKSKPVGRVVNFFFSKSFFFCMYLVHLGSREGQWVNNLHRGHSSVFGLSLHEKLLTFDKATTCRVGQKWKLGMPKCIYNSHYSNGVPVMFTS